MAEVDFTINIGSGLINPDKSRLIHCERRHLKHKAMIADSHRFVVAIVRQRYGIRWATPTEDLKTKQTQRLHADQSVSRTIADKKLFRYYEISC